MKKYLLDTGVILDLLLNRSPWADDASALWEANRHRQITTLVAAFSVPTIFYIVRKQAGLQAAHAAVLACLGTLEIATIDQTALLSAAAMSGPDFEDNLQIACAMHAGADAIVSRDPRGFSGSPIPVLRPGNLAASLDGPATP